jgi:glutamyl-tRNA reductase
VLADLEEIHAHVERNRPARRTELQRAGALVRDEVQRFAAWRGELALAPAVRSVWQRAEEMRRAELARCGPLDADELERLDAVTARLVRTLLDGPTKRVRAARLEPGAPHLDVFRDLFDFDTAPVAPALRVVGDERGAA